MSNPNISPEWEAEDDPFTGYRCPVCESDDIRYDVDASFWNQGEYYYCGNCNHSCPSDDLVEPED